jgi:hypothetical protein
VTGIRLSQTVSVPMMIASPRTTDVDRLQPANHAPTPAETVMVVSDTEVYRSAWHDVEFCEVTEGVVVNLDGELVGVISDGELVERNADD